MPSLTPLELTDTSIPKLGESKIERPEILSVETKLKFNRATAEEMFKRARFVDDDFDKLGYVTVTEVLRAAKPNEPYIFIHVATGIRFCVDHYECDGVIL